MTGSLLTAANWPIIGQICTLLGKVMNAIYMMLDNILTTDQGLVGLSIIIYTILTAFMSPWLDFIFARVICRANADQYTVAIGLWKRLETAYIDSWYTSFAAGAVLISIPIAILFLCLQRFYVDGVSGAVKG